MAFEAAPSHGFSDAPTSGGALLAAATAVAGEAVADPAGGTLIVVVHPESPTHRVIGGTGNSPIRAAVSVAVAAGNDRVWRDAPSAETTERPVASLPEVVRATVEGSGVTSVHVGAIRIGDAVVCAALWFASPTGVADPGARRGVLRLLAAAAEREHQADLERAAAAAPLGPATVIESAGLPVGSDDPDIDALTGLASRARFDREMADFDGDEATLLLVDLDHFTQINDDHGSDVGDAVLREVARRLAAACRRTDIIARLERDQFAVLLVGTDRSNGIQTSRRLLAAIAEPLPAEIGADQVTATVALAHQIGLVDMDELFESADDAVASGKRGGRGRVVVAT